MGAAHHELAAAARIPIDRIRVHPRNIRSKITHLDELAASIRFEGVLEPLVVHKKFLRKSGVQDLELIAGHRRLAAADIAGLRSVPCIVLPTMRDDEVILAMLGENVSRVAVDPDDLGRAVATLRGEFGYSEQAVAERLGVDVGTLRGWAPGGNAGVRAAQAAARRNTGRPAAPRISRTPQVGAKRVHELLTEHDRGGLTADQVVARLRGALGGWEPAQKSRSAS